MRLSFRDIANAGTRFIKGQTPDHVFVFGAGLSIPAGPPPANALLKRAILWREAASPATNINLVNAFCDYFYPGILRSKHEYPDAEDMLGMMDAAQEYGTVRGSGRGYKWRAGYISDARKQLVRLISEFLWSFQHDDVLKKIGYIRNIVRTHSANTVFVSFNYDLLLETAMTLEGVEFSYAIDRSSSSRNVILKPHGSINWSYPSDYERSRRWQQDSCIRFLNRVYVYDEIYPTFLTAKINPPYVLIAPTPHKQIENEFLKRQWTSFSSSVHSCQKITIVGYSLPAADRLARIVLRRSGPIHSSNKKILIIDPGDLADHYKTNISPSVHYVQDYCENYFG